MDKVSVLAITKNGVRIGREMAEHFPSWRIYAPRKFADGKTDVEWFDEPTPSKVGDLFKSSDAVVCLFSLGAVVRLIAPHLHDKKTDPAIIVIDDAKNFVISALSGHLGGANQMATDIAAKLGATPVITTAADVNKTIPVDLIGKEFGWVIDDDTRVTEVSAYMVNGESIGVYQDAGSRNWWAPGLPKNVTRYDSIKELNDSNSKAHLIITDRLIDTENTSTVVFRPKTLIVGIGVHGDTAAEDIRRGLDESLKKFSLSFKSIAGLASIKKPKKVAGLAEFASSSGIPLEYIDRERLAVIEAPNPSDVVEKFEGTSSVSEAAAIAVSGGHIIVEKQKFPPNLTIAVARIPP